VGVAIRLVIGSSGEVSQNLKIDLPYDPEILLLSIQPEEMKTVSPRDVCVLVFTAELFTVP
jgi:hypothetical protein